MAEGVAANALFEALDLLEEDRVPALVTLLPDLPEDTIERLMSYVDVHCKWNSLQYAVAMSGEEVRRQWQRRRRAGSAHDLGQQTSGECL